MVARHRPVERAGSAFPSEKSAVAQNVEIKARATDVECQRSTAVRIADGAPEFLEQTDVFFPVPNGRLKLRIFSPVRGELIQYHREDQSGPRSSDYVRTATDDPETLRHVLTRALGTIGVVAKKRWVYMVGATRIHLDDVAGLGWFWEIEAVIGDRQNAVEGRQAVDRILSELEIRDDDLVPIAYIDLLTRRDSQG